MFADAIQEGCANRASFVAQKNGVADALVHRGTIKRPSAGHLLGVRYPNATWCVVTGYESRLAVGFIGRERLQFDGGRVA